MPQQRKKNGELTVRQDKLSKQNVILYLCGIIPVVWLGLLIAPCLGDGLPGLVQQFGTVMQNPFKIQLCEVSVKTVLILLLVYGIAIGVYLSTEHNYRRREEHGSAKWGTAGSVNKKYANKDKTENKLLTQNVAIGLDGRKHRRNLNVLVCGGSGAGKTRFYAKPNIMNANTSFVVLDPKGELLRDTGYLLEEMGYEIKVLDLIDMEESHPVQEIDLRESLDKLKEALKSGKTEEMETQLQVIEEQIRQSLADKSRACMYLQQVIRAADMAAEEVSADISEIHEDGAELLCQITEQKSFSQACEIVQKYILRVYDAMAALNTSSGERQARMALDYIQKNYMDPNLSLNDICSYLNISTSYFSSIFKEMTGETFTEVLIRTRMEKAKELLENTTLKNYEIAEKVGFADAHYFGISFKKMTGCTPTEYARENRR